MGPDKLCHSARRLFVLLLRNTCYPSSYPLLSLFDYAYHYVQSSLYPLIFQFPVCCNTCLQSSTLLDIPKHLELSSYIICTPRTNGDDMDS